MFLIVMSAFSVNALTTGFSTEKYSQNEYDKQISNLDVKKLTEAPRKRLINNYDVNDDGMLAVAMANDDSFGFTKSRAAVAVYDKDGNYLYGFDFNDTGMIEVEWGSNELNVYSVRGDYIFTVDDNYYVDELLYVPYTAKDNDYFTEYLQSYEKTAGGIDYIGYRGITTDIYKVARLDDKGNEVVIYESDMGLFSPVLICGIIISILCLGGCFLAMVVIPLVIIKKINKKEKVIISPLQK